MRSIMSRFIWRWFFDPIVFPFFISFFLLFIIFHSIFLRILLMWRHARVFAMIKEFKQSHYGLVHFLPPFVSNIFSHFLYFPLFFKFHSFYFNHETRTHSMNGRNIFQTTTIRHVFSLFFSSGHYKDYLRNDT